MQQPARAALRGRRLAAPGRLLAPPLAGAAIVLALVVSNPGGSNGASTGLPPVPAGVVTPADRARNVALAREHGRQLVLEAAARRAIAWQKVQDQMTRDAAKYADIPGHPIAGPSTR